MEWHVLSALQKLPLLSLHFEITQFLQFSLVHSCQEMTCLLCFSLQVF